VKSQVLTKDGRKFPSTLEAALLPYNIPTSVYEQLIRDVHANLPTLHRYLRLRQKIMGLPQLGYEDLYAPIVQSVDLQYTPDEYKGKVGWGHSTYVAGAELARASGARSYVLFHHDPMRTDKEIDDVERRAKELFANSVAAREGLAIDLSARSPARGRTEATGEATAA